MWRELLQWQEAGQWVFLLANSQFCRKIDSKSWNFKYNTHWPSSRVCVPTDLKEGWEKEGTHWVTNLSMQNTCTSAFYLVWAVFNRPSLVDFSSVTGFQQQGPNRKSSFLSKTKKLNKTKTNQLAMAELLLYSWSELIGHYLIQYRDTDAVLLTVFFFFISSFFTTVKCETDQIPASISRHLVTNTLYTLPGADTRVNVSCSPGYHVAGSASQYFETVCYGNAATGDVKTCKWHSKVFLTVLSFR